MEELFKEVTNGICVYVCVRVCVCVCFLAVSTSEVRTQLGVFENEVLRRIFGNNKRLENYKMRSFIIYIRCLVLLW